jgi:hypothetical protein
MPGRLLYELRLYPYLGRQIQALPQMGKAGGSRRPLPSRRGQRAPRREGQYPDCARPHGGGTGARPLARRRDQHARRVPTHSYVNPAHERQIRDIARCKAPDLLVCISSDVLPEIKEYERTSTTVINAYVLPVVQQYCSRLRTDLNRLGVTAPLHIMQSNHRTRPLPLSPACRSMRYVLNSRKGQAAKALLLSIPG